MNDMTTISDRVDLIHPDAQIVTSVNHWTDSLFSFRVTRPRSLRFRSGEFLMLGLLGENGKPILRAYSIASPSWDEELEFYSIKVPNGPLTSKLQHIDVGSQVIVRPKPVGTLVLDALLPGKRCYLVSSGTGIAPFASLLRDPDLYERFEDVVLTHTVREKADLAYGADVVERTLQDPLAGEEAVKKLRYYPTTTREATDTIGRITNLFEIGKVSEDLGLPALGPDDRVMICGSMGLNADMKTICENAGLEEGSNSMPGTFVLEKAFVG